MAAEAQLALEGGLTPPRSLTGLSGPVWGCDPSSLRMSFAAVVPPMRWLAGEAAGEAIPGAPVTVTWSTVSLPRKTELQSWWFALCYRAIVGEVAELAERWGRPDLVLVEEPFGGGGKPGDKKPRTVHPTSNRMLGVLLAGLGHVFGMTVDVQLISPMSWKALALGKGGGHAKPAVYLEWARTAAGYTGELEDEAAAIGIATAAGVKLQTRRSG